jgi:hypothetical protein
MIWRRPAVTGARAGQAGELALIGDRDRRLRPCRSAGQRRRPEPAIPCPDFVGGADYRRRRVRASGVATLSSTQIRSVARRRSPILIRQNTLIDAYFSITR